MSTEVKEGALVEYGRCSRRPVGLEENDNSDSEALMCRIDRDGVPWFERPCEDLSSEISDRCLKAVTTRKLSVVDASDV